MSIPLVIVSDSPYGPTGLGRIALDLRARLSAMPELEVSAIGWEPGPAWGGDARYLGHQDSEHWGARPLAQWWPEHVDRRSWGVVFSIWDPARCFGLRESEASNARWCCLMPPNSAPTTSRCSMPGQPSVAKKEVFVPA